MKPHLAARGLSPRRAAVVLGVLIPVAIAIAAFGFDGSPPVPPVECDGRAQAARRTGQCVAHSDLRVRVHGRRTRATWSGAFGPRGPTGWKELQAERGGIRAVRSLGGTRPHIGVFTVRPGDAPVRSGERAEAVASPARTGGREGSEAWYVWSTYFPTESFRPVPDSTWNIFTQWHGTEPDGCRPNVAMQVNTAKDPPQLRLGARGGRLAPGSCAEPYDNSWDYAPLETGRWHDFALHVRWSSSPRVGFVELVMNGRTVVPRTPHATLYAGQGVYLKQGFYRAPAEFTSRVLHGGVTRLGQAR